MKNILKNRFFLSLVAVVFVFVLLLLYWHYNNFYNKSNPLITKKIKKDLYFETYTLSKGGVLANDFYSSYLTDSATFRKFVGRFDDKEAFRFSLINDDSVKITKFSWRNLKNYKETAIDSTLYSIKQLKEEGHFD